MELSAAVPQTEYRVQTECGRNFVWSAPDLDYLMREVVRKGYRPTLVMENAAFEAMEEEHEWKLNQLALVYELKQTIEQEVKSA